MLTLTRRNLLAAGAAGLLLHRRSFGNTLSINDSVPLSSVIRSLYLRYGDDGFLATLEATFPGLLQLSHVQQVLPFALLVRNPQQQPVRVYGVRWFLTTNGTTATYKHHFLHGSSPALLPYARTGQLAMLYPGQLGVATPFFFISDDQYVSVANNWDYWIGKRLQRFPQAQRFVANKTASSVVNPQLVAIVYKDHAIGVEAPASAHLLQTYRNVEYEQAKRFLSYLDAGASPEEQEEQMSNKLSPLLIRTIASVPTYNASPPDLALYAKAKFASKVSDLSVATGVLGVIQNLMIVTKSRPSKIEVY